MASVPMTDALSGNVNYPGGLSADTSVAAGFDPDRLNNAFAVLREEIAEGCLPGAVAVVARRGMVAAHRALGWAHLAEQRLMAPDTLFDLASLTKVMATLPSVLLLLERGAFRLDDPVARFFPKFTGEGRDEVRIRHLLTHTGGLQPGSPTLREEGTREERIGRIWQVPLQAKPGERIIYTDLGYLLLGELVHRASGQPLDAFVRQHVFEPLGLRETGYNPAAGLTGRTAATEYRDYLGRHQCCEVHDEVATGLGGMAGHAGLFSTAAEVAAYGQMWLEKGGPVLSPATVAAATRDQTPDATELDHRGWGWIVTHARSAYMSCGDLFTPGSFGHTGFTGTSLWVDPTRELAVALLTNRVHLGRTDQILRIRARFHNAVAASVR